MSKVDYIIVGQGLAGSWLAHYLLAYGSTVCMIDADQDATSSKRAAGIFNPITGREMKKTWRAHDVFENLEAMYQSLEAKFQSTFLHRVPIYRPFTNASHINDWSGRITDGSYDSFINEVANPKQVEGVNDPYGGLILKKSGYVDLPAMLASFRDFFIRKEMYVKEVFTYNELKIRSDSVQYKDIIASKIIFCEGALSQNPFWSLPFRPVRGEIMDISCALPENYIINQGVFMIPKKGYVTVGATYDRKDLSFEPQPTGIRSLKNRLEKLYTGTYQIIHERAGVRPATHDRKPYIGFHKKHKNLCIFNGFGTKGVSLAPYFAKQFVQVLHGEAQLDHEVNVERVL